MARADDGGDPGRGLRDDVRLRVAAAVRRAQPGRVAVLATAFGIGTLAFMTIASGAACSWFLLRKRTGRIAAGSFRAERPTRWRRRPPSRPGGAELDGGDGRDVRAIAGSRALSEAGAIGTLGAYGSAVAFLVSALYQFRLRRGALAGVDRAPRRDGRHRRDRRDLVFLVRNARKPNERRIVGIDLGRPHVLAAPVSIRSACGRTRNGRSRRSRRGWSSWFASKTVGWCCRATARARCSATRPFARSPTTSSGEIAFVTYGAPLASAVRDGVPGVFSTSRVRSVPWAGCSRRPNALGLVARVLPAHGLHRQESVRRSGVRRDGPGSGEQGPATQPASHSVGPSASLSRTRRGRCGRSCCCTRITTGRCSSRRGWAN